MPEKIGCVIVTYFPDKGFLERLEIVLLQVNKVVIIDNGSDKLSLVKISEQIKCFNNVELICNNSNLGIAKALNIGCQYLLYNSYLFGLLLDQDSTITDNMVSNLYATMKIYKDSAVVGPQIIPKNICEEDISHKLKYITKSDSFLFSKKPVTDEPLKVAFNITSGSLIDLGIWKKIGGFWEDLFIEGVDNEYGLRVNSYNFKVYIDNNSYLLQEYGNQVMKEFLGKKFFPTFHSPLRYYYVSRNRIMIWKRHGKNHKYYITWDLFSFLNSLLQIILFENQKYKKIEFMFKGYIDGFKQIKGKYHE